MTSRLQWRQQGTALVIAMLFLVILGMLGMTTMTTTTLDERMAGNSRDRDIAMQAAEAALRDAERDLSNTSASFRIVTLANFPAVASPNCVIGLCAEGASTTTNLPDPTKSAFYGQLTGELALDGPAQQPRYMIELLNAPVATRAPGLGAPAAPATVTRNFRITARGVGKNTNTVVIISEVFQMNI